MRFEIALAITGALRGDRLLERDPVLLIEGRGDRLHLLLVVRTDDAANSLIVGTLAAEGLLELRGIPLGRAREQGEQGVLHRPRVFLVDGAAEGIRRGNLEGSGRLEKLRRGTWEMARRRLMS